jgi:acetolactate synthase-1/2/3 large subunit
MSAKRRQADALVETLFALGYRNAYGIPGGGIAGIFAALGRRLRVTITQHEGGAAYMAMGQSLATACREVGLCFGTSGPGITNLITGIAAAFEEQVPMFVLTGNVATTLEGKGAAQDAFPGALDAVAMLKPVTARSVMARSADEIVPLAVELHHATVRERRPMHLNVPVDLASLPFIAPGGLPASRATAPSDAERGSAEHTSDLAAVEQAVAVLSAAERPLVLAGHGIKVSGLGRELGEALSAARIPALITSHAKGVLPDDHPMALGTFGFAAPESSTEALEAYAPDVLAFLGTDLGETSTAGWSPLLAKPPLKIHVDHDATRFHRVYRVELPVHADLRLFLARLHETPPARERAPVARPPTRPGPNRNTAAGVHPADVISVLADVLPDDALVFCDIGNAMAWALNGLPVRRRQEVYIPMALGPMGSGLCAAMGAQRVRPERPVAVLVGDCAMTMHGTELLTAVGAGLPVKVFVLNDGGHGMVEHGLNLLGMPAAGLRLRRPVDFVAFGQSLGLEGKRVDTLQGIRALDWPRWWASGEPMLVEVMIDPAIVPPILARTRVLGITERAT